MTVERGEAVGVSLDRLIEFCPQVYHMAEAHTWPSISTNGLLSTSALLDLFAVTGPMRFSIESENRRESVEIVHPVYGSALIRDQIPMRETALLKCLSGMSPRQWYESLNRRVFFWATQKRLLTLLSAKAYRDRKHCVITVDTAGLLERHFDRVNLSPINSGSAIYRPQPRGPETFLPPSAYPFAARRKRYGQSNTIAEFAVDYAVPDIAEIALSVVVVAGTTVIETLYRR